MTNFHIPEIKSPAEYAKDALVSGMRDFETALASDEEMVIDFDGLPPGHRVFAIGTDSTFVVFHSVGPDERRAKTYIGVLGSRVTLLAQAKPDELDQPRRMGFHAPG